MPKINQNKCISCRACIEDCPADAITGDGRRHYGLIIDQDRCTECGNCLSVCDEGAIERGGSDEKTY